MCNGLARYVSNRHETCSDMLVQLFFFFLEYVLPRLTMIYSKYPLIQRKESQVQ